MCISYGYNSKLHILKCITSATSINLNSSAVAALNDFTDLLNYKHIMFLKLFLSECNSAILFLFFVTKLKGCMLYMLTFKNTIHTNHQVVCNVSHFTTYCTNNTRKAFYCTLSSKPFPLPLKEQNEFHFRIFSICTN